MKIRAYSVYILPVQVSPSRRGEKGLVIAIRPQRYRKNPLRLKRMSFISERTYHGINSGMGRLFAVAPERVPAPE
jgi:hypothetical protein